jgi:hypothetical protein
MVTTLVMTATVLGTGLIFYVIYICRRADA